MNLFTFNSYIDSKIFNNNYIMFKIINLMKKRKIYK